MTASTYGGEIKKSPVFVDNKKEEWYFEVFDTDQNFYLGV